MGQVADSLKQFLKKVPEHIQLVAVSKTKSNEDILDAYQFGHKTFGENKVQELTQKAEELPKDIDWHYIGHLQTNKVKYLATFVGLIHAVDRLKLLKEINKQAKKNDRIIKCLLQFHIAEEDTKFGLDMDEAKAILDSEQYQNYANIEIVGVMGMATYTENNNQIRKEFKRLHQYFDQIKRDYFPEKAAFKEISMGMSGDYQIAIDEGSTMIRVGSAIFGERVY